MFGSTTRKALSSAQAALAQRQAQHYQTKAQQQALQARQAMLEGMINNISHFGESLAGIKRMLAQAPGRRCA